MPSKKRTRNAGGLVLIALLLSVILIGTNPSGADYERYVQAELMRDAGRQKNLGKAVLEAVFSKAVAGMARDVTTRQDYVLWSYYVTDIGVERVEVLGILGTFYVMNRYGIRR